MTGHTHEVRADENRALIEVPGARGISTAARALASGRVERFLLRAVIALTLVGLVAAALAKPFHVDDTLFVRGARALAEHGDPLAFTVNWTGTEEPASLAVLNPPLAQACLALVGALAGHGSVAMHVPSALALLLLAFAVARLAEVVRVSKGWTLALALASPAVFVCAGNVMPDVLCAALSTLGIATWCSAAQSGSRAALAGSLVALSAAALTKYTGALAILPCAAFALTSLRTLSAVTVIRRCAWLLVPVLVLVAYDRWMEAQHGVAPIARALRHSQAFAPASSGWVLRAYLATSFVGAAGLFGWMVLVSRRARSAGWVVGVLAVAFGTAWIVLDSRVVAEAYPAWIREHGRAPALAIVQSGLFAASGVWTIVSAATAWSRLERPYAILIGTWFWVGVAHVVSSNWDVSMRGVLWIVVPVAVLAASHVEACDVPLRRWACRVGLLATFVVSALLAWGDHVVASLCRDDARETCGPGVVFYGHWGFQHYAEELGARALDARRIDEVFATEARLVVPMLNSFHAASLDPERFAAIERNERAIRAPLLALGPRSGAGFYAARLAPLPFAWNTGETMQTFVMALRPREAATGTTQDNVRPPPR